MRPTAPSRTRRSALMRSARLMVWVEDEGKHVLKCFCHNSEYDPRANANVIFGPAPRRLPVRIDDGALVAAGTFLSKVGFRPG